MVLQLFQYWFAMERDKLLSANLRKRKQTTGIVCYKKGTLKLEPEFMIKIFKMFDTGLENKLFCKIH